MQPPPQTAPPGVGGPPPLAPSWNMHWRNGPYGRRANAPTSAAAAAAGPVQPVTDPFAFGKQGPRGSPLSSAPQGDPAPAKGSSSSAFPPSAAPLHLSSEDLPHATTLTLTSVSASQSGASGSLPTSTASMSTFPKGVTNSTEMHESAEHGPPRHTVEQPQPVRIVPENPFSASVPGRPSGGPDVSRNPGNPAAVPSPLPAFSFLQQTVPQWIPPQSSAYLPYPEPLSRNAFGSAAHSSISVSHPGPQLDRHPTPPQQPGLPGVPQAPFMLAEAPGVTLPPSSAWQGPRGTNAWAGQLPQEHFYLQPLEATYPSGHPTSQENIGHGQGVSEAGSRPCPDEADSGTISMFFKGDEAENEEILSSENSAHAARADADAFHQTMGHTYYQPLHDHQGPPAHFSPAQANAAMAAEAALKEADAQRFPRVAVVQQASEKVPFLGEDRASLVQQAASCPASGLYESVENQECVQNQEVLPREPPSQNRSSPAAASDSSRYASLAPLLPKNQAGGSHLEGGLNLEAPSGFPRPVRPDSVSSNYSNLSPRSAAGPARPQELGTFIQQESGKPEQEASRCFFKQIDSSPLGAEVGAQEPGKNYHSPSSQVPTPSPPKPMGVFQTSVNSCFEPVRSHSLGMKPPETDPAKAVAELREDRPSQRAAQRSAVVSVASPGNLEQPPDNLETLFLPPAHSLPLSLGGRSGSPRQPASGAGVEKRATTRAQGLGKKCESPATTLWAHNELPSFGGNVLLAPAAPAVYVPAKPSSRVVQPPEGALPSKPGSRAGSLPSENLENPPQLGDDEALCSQGSLGYASLLSSPPTEALQNQSVLLAPPSQIGSLAPPAGSSLSLQPGQPENKPSAKAPGTSGCSLSAEKLPGGPVHSNASFFHSPLGTAETAAPKPLVQSGSQAPLNLARDGPQPPATEGLPLESAGQLAANVPVSHAAGLAPLGGPSSSLPGWPQNASHCPEVSRVLDLAGARPQEQSRAGAGPQGLGQPLWGSQGFPLAPGPAGPGEAQARGLQQFYQQVTKDSGPMVPSERGMTLEQGPAAPRHPSLSPNLQTPPGNRARGPSPRPCSGAPLEGSSALPPLSHPQPSTDFRQDPRLHPGVGPPPGLTATSGPPPARPPSRHEEQYPQNPQNAYGLPPNSYYYYYRQPYDGYSYPSVDPRAAHLNYQDAYGQYSAPYTQYDQTAAYRDWYSEPERPSSRASHTSERPRSRQDYPDDYYTTKSGWNGYYGDYYSNLYDNGDRYPSNYDARFRDPRFYDQRYWYNTDHNLYPKKEPSQRGSSHERYEDHWRYDPRFVSSFDEDLEPRRDPYGDDSDWRSVHSEHSGHSLHSSRSRQSSFSSRSQQSQRYRSNHDLSVNAYDGDPQPISVHADYSSGGYYINQPPLSNYDPLAQMSWAGIEQAPSRPLTPEKFSVPHVCAKFGPGGQLIKVLSNLPSEGQPALVEIHSLEMVMQHSSEQEEMRAFPGPLTKDDTHKVDVINFAQNKATRCSQNDALIDKESARLLWDFVVLLCRQNGTVVGTDIAELLLQDHKTVWLPGKSPNEANLIDFTSEAVEQVAEESGEAQLSFLTDSLLATINSLEKETERFRELLLYGRKKDALESAMKHGLWGHALLLASKMDSRTHARVMTRFANSLPINDPLQTVYQLMSGRMPAASTCCGDEKWGDWRPHLAMVLSNLTNNTDVESRTIVTMGDTLASKGLLDAAHFCYLMAQEDFGVYTKKTTKLVLIGANHSLPFLRFASNEAIQRTEAYEYAQSLGTQSCPLPNFQVFKFIYACRLAEMGLIAQAFHYCEVISKAILTNPGCSSPVLISQVIQISSQLRLFDPQLKEKPEQELFIEPSWLIQLRHLDGQIKEGCFRYSVGGSSPQQYSSSTPSSEPDHASQNEGLGGGLEVSSKHPQLASLLPNVVQPTQSIHLLPSAPPTMLDGSVAPTPSSQQEAAGAVPYHPLAPFSMGPGPGSFSPYETELNPMYGGPAGLPPQGPEVQPNEGTQHEAVVADSPVWKAVPKPRDEDFYGKMANMGPGRRSRSTSQSSTHRGLGRRSRTTSESSVHSIGRERQNSATTQPSPPPPSIPERKKSPKEAKKEQAPQKSGGHWLSWLMGKSKNEAHLPEDKNKSIVWDEKKQRWINLDEPEEETKPPPPPPTGFPQAVVPSGLAGPPNTSVNMFSRRAAGSKARYVDIMNPSKAKSPVAAPAPADLFAPLAPMPIPANVFVPNSVPEEQTLLEGGVAQDQVAPGNDTNPESIGEVPYLNSAAFPPGPELPAPNPGDAQSGEASSGDPPSGAVQLYNPSQFGQSAAAPASSRPGRFGQRKYPTLK